MKKLLLILLFFFLVFQISSAQHEADNWYFGLGAGITFKNGNPVALTDSRMAADEGCAVVSDKLTGELLFYTNGVKVWNKYHQIMKNGTGLMSESSCTQAALIVPNPGNSLQYYIFTAPDLTGGTIAHTSLYYSLVSMETPEGEVINKNTFIMDEASERLAATLDCTGKGYWVVAHHRSKGILYSYHVISTGVNPTPVISKYTDETVNSVSGYMKFSPDRTKLAMASALFSSAGNPLLLFNFNAETGSLTENNKLGQGQNMRTCYGVAFSPDNTKLYTTVQTETEVNSLCYIYQYDLSLSTPLLVKESLSTYRIPLPTDSSNISALQLASDGKIYVSYTGQANLGILDQPNEKGISYKVHGVNIEPRINRKGLPNFMDYIFNQPPPGPNPLAWCTPQPLPPPHAVALSDSGCLGNTLKFIDRSSQNPTKRVWTFDNGTPSTSTDSIVTVSYTQVGIHKVWLKVSNESGSDSTIVEAIIFPFPIARAGEDKTLCLGASTEVGAPSETGSSYSWLPTTNLDDATKANPIVKPTDNGSAQYILTVTNSHGCKAYDTVQVTTGNITAKVSNDTALCFGSSVQLLASGGSDYEWSPSTSLDNPNIPNPIVTPTSTTTYKVRVSSGTCEDFAYVTVTVNPFPKANAGPDLSLCKGETLRLGVTSQVGNTYSWQPVTGLDDPAKSNPNATPTVTTEYILTVTNSTGCSSKDTVLISVGNIKAIVSNDTAVCAGSSVRLSASGGANYQWSPTTGLDNPYTPNPICTPNSTTLYTVVVTNGSCVDTAFVTVDITPPPIANAGLDKIICIGEQTTIGVPKIAGNTYSWTPTTGLSNPNASQTDASPSQTITYILNVTNQSGCISQDTVVVKVNPANERLFTLTPPSIIILPGKPFETTLNIPSGVQTWKVHLDYNNLLLKFNSIQQMTNGISAASQDKNGQLYLNGIGGSGTVVLGFNSFLPQSSDTTFPLNLTIDSTDTQPCETVTARGITLQLGVFCGRNIRNVSSTGKKYFLTNKENGVNFGVGLSGNVRLELYDYTGTLKEVLADGNFEAGEYSVEFDLPTGMYFCRMSSGVFEDVDKMIIVK